MKKIQLKPVVPIMLLVIIFFTNIVSTSGARITPNSPLSIGIEDGENSVNALLNLKNKTLKIYGSGNMKSNNDEAISRWFYGYEKNIKKIVIEKGVTSIGDYAFGSYLNSDSSNSFTNLEKISIPKSIKKIGRGAFYGASALKKITIPSSVEILGSHAFNSAENLRTIKLNKGLMEIGDGAFLNCKKLTKIRIPEGITIINSNTFDKYLENIILPSTLKEIKSNAFKGQVNAIIKSPDVKIEENAFKSGSIITCIKDSITEKSALEKGNLSIKYIKKKK